MESFGNGIAALMILAAVLLGAVAGWALVLVGAGIMWFFDAHMPLWGWVIGPVIGGIVARIAFKIYVE